MCWQTQCETDRILNLDDQRQKTRYDSSMAQTNHNPWLIHRKSYHHHQRLNMTTDVSWAPSNTFPPVISIGLFFTQVCRNHDISSKHNSWPSRKDLFIKQLTWSSVKTFTWVLMLGCCTILCISSSFLKLRTGCLFLMGEPMILFPNICRTAVHTNTHTDIWYIYI